MKPRGNPRTRVLLRTAIRTPVCKGSGILRNLSAGGACLTVDDAEPAPGESIDLTLRHIGQISGRISWARSGQIGVAFDRTIDPGQVLRRAA